MENITKIVAWVTTHLPDMIEMALAVVGAAAVIAKYTPTPKDDAFFAKVKAILDKVGHRS